MDILFIGKRFYTNRDAYTEKFGRIYQLPYHWSQEKNTQLWLIDYHTKEKNNSQDNQLNILSTPVISFLFIFSFFNMILKRPRLVVASGDCYIGLLGFILAKLTFSKFVFDVYDKYDTFSGYRNLFGVNVYQFLLKKSNICLFASQKLMNDSKNICKQQILVQNGIDSNLFYPRDKITARKEYGFLGNDLYIGYFGGINIERGITDLIDAVKFVRNDGVNLKILLAGSNQDNINLDYDFIVYLGNMPFKKVPAAMACCDLLALPYQNSEFLDNASSCKIAEYIAVEIPVVATATPNLLRNFESTSLNNNILAQCSNPSSLADIILVQLREKIKIKITVNLEWETISRESYFHIKTII